MSGNERIPEALSDFDSLIRAGVSVDEALSSSATDNDLKTEVVRFRAEIAFKDFGGLEAYRSHCLRHIELKAERRAQLQPLADQIEAIYAKGSQLPFVPIGNFIRANFSEGYSRDEAFSFSRDYQKKWRS